MMLRFAMSKAYIEGKQLALSSGNLIILKLARVSV